MDSNKFLTALWLLGVLFALYLLSTVTTPSELVVIITVMLFIYAITAS